MCGIFLSCDTEHACDLSLRIQKDLAASGVTLGVLQAVVPAFQGDTCTNCPLVCCFCKSQLYPPKGIAHRL